jgi:DNA polymerase I-like protein with 3'-5' exonuclease and polymerase domains
MLAEYLLTNQVERMPSLEQCCANHGIEMAKSAEVAAAMKAGVCPSTLPPEQLDEYLTQDINMTKALFLKQKEEFYKRPVEWQVMFINQMFFLVNTLRASVNGMKVDMQYVEQQKLEIWLEVTKLEKYLKEFMGVQTSTDPSIWNPASNSDLTVFLNGGTKKWDERAPNGVYKTGASVGKTKYKIEKRQFIRCPIFESRGSVDISALKDMQKSALSSGMSFYSPFLDNLIKYKDMNKNLNTYFEGYMNHATDDGYIKPKYNHGLTPTGRLTCSGPNLQNIKA